MNLKLVVLSQRVGSPSDGALSLPRVCRPLGLHYHFISHLLNVRVGDQNYGDPDPLSGVLIVYPRGGGNSKHQ
jgi:hypothetical protein